MNTTLPRLDPKLLHLIATSLTSTKDHGGGGLQAHTGRKEKIITMIGTYHEIHQTKPGCPFFSMAASPLHSLAHTSHTPNTTRNGGINGGRLGH